MHPLLKRFFPVLLALSFASGGLFFLLYHEWLIICFNTGIRTAQEEAAPIQKKMVRLHFFNNSRWNSEETEILWSTDLAQNILFLSNRWLSLLEEEGLSEKKIAVQSAALSTTGQLYLSFDQHPFEPEHTTQQKYLFIEGLLKTIRENGIKLSGIYFLVHHKPLTDYHLDFSTAWPLETFFKS